MVCWVLATLAACSDGDDVAGDAQRFDPLISALETDLAAGTAYGVSVAVMERGEVVFARSFGTKDAAGEVPLTPDTLMQIGSTTKQMTAVALLQKVQAGQVSLDDTLEDALPDFDFALDAGWDDRVTLHHLLSHQGGFVDFVPWLGPADDTELADGSYGLYADEFWVMNPPGRFWNYSNPHFVFAGLITEELDDRFWPDLIVEDVFRPLGMNRTFARKSEVEADGDYALSYGLGTDTLPTGEMGPVEMSNMPDPAWARPTGLVWSTPTQMMAWAEFVLRGNAEVLSDELRAEVTAEHARQRPAVESQHYGYGMVVERGYRTSDGSWYETPVWWHDGATLSFTHWLYMLPEYDFAISICASGRTQDFSNSIDTAITSLVDLPQPSAFPGPGFDPAALDHHVGVYLDPFTLGPMIVTRDGDRLMVDLPILASMGFEFEPELDTLSSNEFVLHFDGARFVLTFVPETDGGPSHYVRTRSFVATRVEEGEAIATTAGLVAERTGRDRIERALHDARGEELQAVLGPPGAS